MSEEELISRREQFLDMGPNDWSMRLLESELFGAYDRAMEKISNRYKKGEITFEERMKLEHEVIINV